MCARPARVLAVMKSFINLSYRNPHLDPLLSKGEGRKSREEFCERHLLPHFGNLVDMFCRLWGIGNGRQSHMDYFFLTYREAFASRENTNRSVLQIVDCDTGDACTPEIFTDPVAVVPIEDHAGRPINEDGFCTKPFRAACEAEEIASLPFLQGLVGFEKGNRDPLDLVLRSHGPILPVFIIL